MRAVQIFEHGGPEVLQLVDLPDPVAGPGEVLVRMTAASINHLDLWVRRGMPGFPIAMPHIPGCDGTGVIAALGPGVTDLAVGDRVVVLPGHSSGQSEHDRVGNDHLSDDYGIRGEHSNGLDCELVALERRYVMPLPAGIDPVEAAAVPLVFLTAWGMLIERAELAEGETVLVLAGTSGVGSAAIQIALDRGARVITTAGSDAKRELCKQLGAHEILDHHDADWPKAVKRLTEGRGCDVVVEHVGPATWESSMRSLARNGRLVTCGGTTGPKVSVLLPHLFMKNLSLLGSTMGPARAFPTIFDGVARGAYRPVIDSVVPLDEIVEAHRRLEAGDALGKIVLKIGD
jgi:NADPH:quinone reductase-like Zn-dependent oxidoreductase